MTEQIPLTKISERFGNLRIVNPQADRAMLRSMEKYGQMAPVVVSRMQQDHYELLDGFKRLRAGRQLSLPSLNARILNLGLRAGKVAVMQLNWIGKSISSMEEALVVHSLCHEDGLTQVEIATLLGRHKSWVCRRISLIERLSDEVQEDIKLGLLPTSIGAELAKLQRSNQEALLDTIRKHHLTWRETRRMVSALQASARFDSACLLRDPWEILQPQDPIVMIPDKISDPVARELHRKLVTMQEHCRTAEFAIRITKLGQFSEEEASLLISCCREVLVSIEQAKESLMQILDAYETAGTR
ncbi:MAG: ParB N-terminal domain-containing protein [Chloroflexi bacterium]|nr:ParB N-terminal domain-containing protein [Chloroflexota bacterium]